MSMKQLIALFAATALLSPAVFAHAGGHHEAHWYSGLLHPITGWDHFVAMALMGAFAAKARTDRAMVLLSLIGGSFLAGLFLAQVTQLGSLLESVVLASVVMIPLSGWVLGKSKIMEALVFAIFALFGASHGLVQASESVGSALLFGTGAAVSSMLLCVIGYGVARQLLAGYRQTQKLRTSTTHAA